MLFTIFIATAFTFLALVDKSWALITGCIDKNSQGGLCCTGDIEVDSSVTAIGYGAFQYCQITSVVIPSSVTSIGDYAFSHNQLTSVTIPSSVTSIGYRSFYDNPLTSACFEGLIIPESGAFPPGTSLSCPESTLSPSRLPSARPTQQPTMQPTGDPSGQPSMQPSAQPSMQPSDHYAKQYRSGLTFTYYSSSNTSSATRNTTDVGPFYTCSDFKASVFGSFYSGDTYLRIRDVSGNLLASNDKYICEGSELEYSPPTCQDIYLSMGCYGSSACSGSVYVTFSE